jgi:hypothetical protein
LSVSFIRQKYLRSQGGISWSTHSAFFEKSIASGIQYLGRKSGKNKFCLAIENRCDIFCASRATALEQRLRNQIGSKAVVGESRYNLLPPRIWHQFGYHIGQLEYERFLSWWKRNAQLYYKVRNNQALLFEDKDGKRLRTDALAKCAK